MTRRDWLYVLLAYAALAAYFAIVMTAHGQTPHDRFHYVYEGWLTAAGGSCCNDQDCAPTNGRWRFGPEGYEVQIGGEWRKVPAIAVRPYTSPDGDAHLCVWRDNILCFVPGSGA